MIDHTGVNASDFEASKRFYLDALTPLGYGLQLEFGGSVAGFGEPGRPEFWIARVEANRPPIHVAFRANSRRKVDAFYEAALGAGGRDNGARGCGRNITRTITGLSSWIRTATISKQCATRRRDGIHRTPGAPLFMGWMRLRTSSSGCCSKNLRASVSR